MKRRVSAMILGLGLAAPLPAAAGELWLTIDQARLYTFDEPVGSIVVGNPSIADVTVKSSRELVLFGKMPGSTSLAFFDKEGAPLRQLTIRVQNPTANVVTLQAGTTRYTFSCTNLCEQTNTIGDGSNDSRAELGSVAQQAQRKVQMAAQAGSGPSASVASRGVSESEAADAIDGEPGT